MKNRNEHLDFLRAVAVLLVLLCHFEWLNGRADLPRWEGLLVHGLIRNGWIGVDLFFVLSGFLISGLLFREYLEHGCIKPGRFYIRRGLKIYPAFYTLIAATMFYNVVIINRPPTSAALLSELLFVQNYWSKIWDHTWTLAVEEHFYFLLPVVLLCLTAVSRNKRNPFGGVPLVFVVVAIGALVSRYVTLLTDIPPYFRTYSMTHCRLDALMFGVLLSYWWTFHPKVVQQRVRKHAWVIVVLIVLCIVLVKAPRNNWWLHFGGFTLIWLAFGGLLLLLCCNPGHGYIPTVVLKPVAYVGEYSYSIYLWHGAVAMWGQALLQALGVSLGFWPLAGLYVVGSVVVGIVLAKLIEFPVLRLRERYFPSRTQSPVRVAAPDRV